MALPMSPTNLPVARAAMPCHMAASVTSESRWSSGSAVPTITVRAESECQPSTIAPPSIEMMSPSCSTRPPGMPWTTSSLTEVQIVAGKPW